jgi:hypothetical protein
VAGVRFLAIGAVLGCFLLAAVRLAFSGDAFATALLVGFASPWLALVVAALVPTKPAPSKVDPAKIARLERELEIGPEPPDRVREHAATMAEWDAVTTVATPPAERSVDDCSCDYSGGA